MKYRREPADATVNNMQVAIIQFFRYLEMEELIDRNPARLIRPCAVPSGRTTGCERTSTQP